MIGVTASALLSSSIAAQAIKVVPAARQRSRCRWTRSLPWQDAAMSAPSTTPVSRIFRRRSSALAYSAWPVRSSTPSLFTSSGHQDIDQGASVGFETVEYRLRLVGCPCPRCSVSRWTGTAMGRVESEPRIFQRLQSDGSRRLHDQSLGDGTMGDEPRLSHLRFGELEGGPRDDLGGGQCLRRCARYFTTALSRRTADVLGGLPRDVRAPLDMASVRPRPAVLAPSLYTTLFGVSPTTSK